MQDETHEQTAQDPVETLPAVLTAAQVTSEVIARLKAYSGEVLADVSDRKAAIAIDDKRKEVKRVRLVAAKIIDGEREEAMRTNQRWLDTKREVCGGLEEVEGHLAAEVQRHEAWKLAEERRIEDEKRASRAKRFAEAKEVGVDVSLEQIETATSEEWDSIIADARRAQELAQRAQKIADLLTELGDVCSMTDAAELTDEQAEHRIGVARKDKDARDERARIEAEEKKEAERKERERLETVAHRVRELAELGVTIAFETLSQSTNEQYAELLANAMLAKERAEEARRQADDAARAEQARAQLGLARAKTLADLGEYRHDSGDLALLEEGAFEHLRSIAEEAKSARDAETARQLQAEQERQEATRQAQERAEEQERQEAAARERERQEALRPQREAVAEWAQAALDAMPSTPDIDDPDILRAMRDHVERARLALLDLRDRMTQEPADG